MVTRKAAALVVASWALGGCNVLVGLDDVNIVPGTGGGGGAGASGGGTTTGAGAQGGGATTGSTGGATGGTASGGGNTSGTGGETSTSSTGTGGETSTSSTGTGGAGTTSSTGGETSSTGTGGAGTTSSTGGSGGAPCGDGVITAPEQCDDGDDGGGDGCSEECLVEPFHQCTVAAPSACVAQEVLCADGTDSDGDMVADFWDTDCELPWYAPSNPCQNIRIYWSVNVPVAVPDNGAGQAASPIFVPDDFAVGHTAVLLDISHPRASDVDAALIPPFGSPRELTSGNGGNGSGYDGTLFDPVCATSVTAGAAPFQNCYKPESLLPANGQPAKGVWTLRVSDSGPGQSGTLERWGLILCEQ